MKNKLLYTLLTIFVLFSCFSVWKIFFAKTESYHQEAQTINNIEVYNPEDSFFVGIKVLGIKVGISKPIIKKTDEAIKEIK
jgi:hypothetical protein